MWTTWADTGAAAGQGIRVSTGRGYMGKNGSRVRYTGTNGRGETGKHGTDTRVRMGRDGCTGTDGTGTRG